MQTSDAASSQRDSATDLYARCVGRERSAHLGADCVGQVIRLQRSTGLQSAARMDCIVWQLAFRDAILTGTNGELKSPPSK